MKGLTTKKAYGLDPTCLLRPPIQLFSSLSDSDIIFGVTPADFPYFLSDGNYYFT